MRPLPKLRSAFVKICREESRNEVLLVDNLTNVEGSTLIAKGNAQANTNKKNGRPWCEFCKKLGHLLADSWKTY